MKQTHMKHLRILAVHIIFLIGSYGVCAQAEVNVGQKVFLHLVCDGGLDPSMVFEWKGGSPSSYASEAGAVTRVSLSGLEHVSHPSRPAVDQYFDRWGDRTAVVNGITAADLTARSFGTADLHVSVGSKRRSWLSAYAEDTGKGRPAPVLMFPDISINGDAAEMSLLAAIPRGLVNSSRIGNRRRKISPLPDSVQENLFKALRQDLIEFSSGLRSGSGDQLKIAHLDRQIRINRTLKLDTPAIWEQVYDGTQPDFVNHGKLALEYFARNRSMGAYVLVGGRAAWNTPTGHFVRHASSYEELFSGIDSILSHAYTLGIQSRLVVVVSTQHGKTPWLNDLGGKDPWPVFSAMVWGDGIRSGMTGRSDSTGRPVKVNPQFGTTTGKLVTLSMENVYASLLYLGGIDYRRWTTAAPVSKILEVK